MAHRSTLTRSSPALAPWLRASRRDKPEAHQAAHLCLPWRSKATVPDSSGSKATPEAAHDQLLFPSRRSECRAELLQAAHSSRLKKTCNPHENDQLGSPSRHSEHPESPCLLPFLHTLGSSHHLLTSLASSPRDQLLSPSRHSECTPLPFRPALGSSHGRTTRLYPSAILTRPILNITHARAAHRLHLPPASLENALHRGGYGPSSSSSPLHRLRDWNSDRFNSSTSDGLKSSWDWPSFLSLPSRFNSSASEALNFFWVCAPPSLPSRFNFTSLSKRSLASASAASYIFWGCDSPSSLPLSTALEERPFSSDLQVASKALKPRPFSSASVHLPKETSSHGMGSAQHGQVSREEDSKKPPGQVGVDGAEAPEMPGGYIGGPFAPPNCPLILRADLDERVLRYLLPPIASQVAIIHGPRGTGKSTLVHLALGALRKAAPAASLAIVNLPEWEPVSLDNLGTWRMPLRRNRQGHPGQMLPG